MRCDEQRRLISHFRGQSVLFLGSSESKADVALMSAANERDYADKKGENFKETLRQMYAHCKRKDGALMEHLDFAGSLLWPV